LSAGGGKVRGKDSSHTWQVSHPSRSPTASLNPNTCLGPFEDTKNGLHALLKGEVRRQPLAMSASAGGPKT